MTYKFKWKRKFFWKTVEVRGHHYNEKMDRMALFLPDGGILELPKWSEYQCLLGNDWVLAVKEKMEQESGQQINLTGELKNGTR